VIEQLTQEKVAELAAKRGFKAVVKVAKEALDAGYTAGYTDNGYYAGLELSGHDPTITVTFSPNPSTGYRRFHCATVNDDSADEPELIWSMKALSARLSSSEGPER
jgi:hypothetical protein